MAEHVDKNRVFMWDDKGTPKLTKDQQDALTKQLMGVSSTSGNHAEYIKAKKQKVFDLYAEFVKDNTNIERINRLGITWMKPGFLIEVFVADMAEPGKTVIVEDDAMLKFAPFAKILAVSPENKEIGGPRAKLQPGDIVFMGDLLSCMTVSQAYKNWEDGKKATGKLEGKPPYMYNRRLHEWILQGRIFHLDKAELMFNMALSSHDEVDVRKFRGPWVFMLEQNEIGLKMDNPFGL